MAKGRPVRSASRHAGVAHSCACGLYAALTGNGVTGIAQIRFDEYQLHLTNAQQGVTNQALFSRDMTYSFKTQYVMPIGGDMFIEPQGGIQVCG